MPNGRTAPASTCSGPPLEFRIASNQCPSGHKSRPGRDLGRRKKQIENGAVSSRLRAAPDMHETLMFLHYVFHH